MIDEQTLKSLSEKDEQIAALRKLAVEGAALVQKCLPYVPESAESARAPFYQQAADFAKRAVQILYPADVLGPPPHSSPTPCSAETAAELYRLLEYYRNFAPFCVGMTEEDYATTEEAKIADAALDAYRTQTGHAASRKPSGPGRDQVLKQTGIIMALKKTAPRHRPFTHLDCVGGNGCKSAAETISPSGPPK